MDAITVVFYAAIIGAGAALLGGIVAGLFSLFAIRMNHRADLRKIAYEKQLEALRELYETLVDFSDTSRSLVSFMDEHHNGEGVGPIYQAWSQKYDRLDAVYRKNAVYIPDSVDNEYNNRKAPNTYNPSKVPTEEILNSITDHNNRVLREIKKYLYK